MNASKLFSFLFALFIISSCGIKDNKSHQTSKGQVAEIPVNMPLDKGFSDFITGYTSGTVPANSTIEIRFTPDFASKANKSASGLFVFEPSIKGKTEWKDETTLVFTPSRPLDTRNNIYRRSESW